MDVIVQDWSMTGSINISFTVHENDASETRRLVEELKQQQFGDLKILEERNLAKVSIIGGGMQHHPGVAAKMFEILAQEKIDIKLITTSEIKVSCLIKEERIESAVTALHRSLGLDRD